MRQDKRTIHQLRETRIVPNVLPYSEGSAEITMGGTRVICSASVDMALPKWIKEPKHRLGNGGVWYVASFYFPKDEKGEGFIFWSIARNISVDR